MRPDVLPFREIDATHLAIVGGKGANLGELSRIPGIRVPDGFCVTTDAYRRIVAHSEAAGLLDRLSRLNPEDRDAISSVSGEIRRAIEATPSPGDLAIAITGAIERDRGGPAVRVVRRPRGLVPERPRCRHHPPRRSAMLGLALHGARGDLPSPERHRRA